MISRLLATVVLMTSGLAAADERPTELVPSCADVDLKRDTLTPELRVRATQQLTRVLEREQLLVVTAGCVDHYVVSHEHVDGVLVVRIAGPHGSRRMRNGSLGELSTMYARMVASLLEPPPPEPEAKTEPEATAEPEPESDDEAGNAVEDSADAAVETAAAERYPADPGETAIDAVPPDEAQARPDRIIYGPVLLGSLGGGWGIGYRRASTEHLVMDFSVTGVSRDDAEAVAFAAEALYVPHPRESWTPYVGGGLSVATQSDAMETGSGFRAELTAGISFARTGTFRWFAQIDSALPMFSQHDYMGRTSYVPSMSAALGVGF
jgi:hypothetical protein